MVKAIKVHASPDRVHLSGDVTQDLRMLADSPLRNLQRRPSVRSMDLLTIAGGVYAADRAVKRRATASDETGARTLHLQVAVRDLQFWSREDISARLDALLLFLTGESWTFGFEAAPADGSRDIEQLPLDMPWTRRPRRVALYSGGLDSAAGLANKVLTGAQDYILVTVGHQSGLRRRCTDQIQRLADLTGTPRQLHVTLVTLLRSGVARRISTQERSQRSRAFLFCAAAAAVAQSCGIEDIDVFENGVGALNLPLTVGMLDGGLATRGAHPRFLQLMSQLATEVAAQPIRYSLPFLQNTKAEMLLSLKGHKLSEWLELSRSCVHTSLRERRKSHCGECAGCVERRQAFAFAQVPERAAEHYRRDIFRESDLHQANADYLRRYIDDAAAWLSDDSSVLRRLNWHLANTDMSASEEPVAAERQRRHAREVVSCFGNQAPRKQDMHLNQVRNIGRPLELEAPA